MNYDEITAEAKRLEEKRKGLRRHRPARNLRRRSMRFSAPRGELSAHRGTVGELSDNCHHADQRTTEAAPRWRACAKS